MSKVVIKFYQGQHNENLPKNGWFQICKHCKHRITGITKTLKVIEGKQQTRIFKVYVCKDCLFSFDRDDSKKTKFKSRCNNYISEYLTTSSVKSPTTCFQTERHICN